MENKVFLPKREQSHQYQVWDIVGAMSGGRWIPSQVTSESQRAWNEPLEWKDPEE